MKRLRDEGIPIWHANFETIPSLAFFKQDLWKHWILKGDTDRIEQNYNRKFVNSDLVYRKLGLGFLKPNFLSKGSVNYLIKSLKKIIKC